MLFPATHARDDAEGAVVVAPLDDTHVLADPYAAGARESLALRIVVAGLELRDTGFVIADRDHGVEVREPMAQSVALLPHQAAGQRDGALGGLPVPQLVELRVDPVLGCLPDHARVQDGDVSALERVLDVTRGQEPPREAFGVRRVHLACYRPVVDRATPATSL